MPRWLLSDSALCSNGLIQVVQMRAQPAILFHADIFAKRFDQFIMDFLFLTIGVLFQNLRNAHAVALLTIGQHAGHRMLRGLPIRLIGPSLSMVRAIRINC